jgi:hypothetical protein
MTTNELVKAILTDASPSPSPSLLALLGEHAKVDPSFWNDVVTPPSQALTW